MKLLLGVKREGSSERNFRITAPPHATVGEVAASLQSADPSVPGAPLNPLDWTLRVTGAGLPRRSLSHTTALGESGIRSGSHVELAPVSSVFPEHQQAEVAVVTVVGGPDAGRSFALTAGTSTIGRNPSCDVVLADPLVSKVHARINVGAVVEVWDNASANGVLVGGLPVGRMRVGPDDVIVLGDTEVLVRRTAHAAEYATTNEVAFLRSPRVIDRTEPEPIRLPDPPRLPEPVRFPLVAMAAPMLMGVALFAITQSPTSLIFVALSPLIMVGNYLDQRFRGKRKLKQERDNFVASLSRLDQGLEVARHRDRARLLTAHPGTLEAVTEAIHLGPMLWSRRPEHPEFLTVRLGLGTIPAPTRIEPSTATDGIAECQAELDRRVGEYSKLPDAPLVADLRTAGSLGLCGGSTAEEFEAMARGVVAQLLSLHSPAEVVVACATSKAGARRWAWLEWMPHTSSPHSPLGALHLASDPSTTTLLVAHLEELIENRAQGRVASLRGPLARGDQQVAPTVPAVVFLVDESSADLGRLNRIAERGPDIGVHVVWCGTTRTDLPAACRTFLDLGTGGGQVGHVRLGATSGQVRVELVAPAMTSQLAQVLSPVVDAGVPTEDTSDIPASVSMLSLTGSDVVEDPASLLRRWQQNQSIVQRAGRPVPLKHPINLRALVGHGVAAEPFTLDLRTQGPHALVGGTTGAGKSEFLQSWVLGMATAHSPDRITFLFVDYKGGSAFAKCLELPHSVGLVTDLTPYLVRRALTSLRAELRYREHLLKDKGAKDLVELEKRGDPDCPPSLIIVVDEFAALVTDVPEFVDGVVDVAARGRSLGLHLILATQRPSGVIRDNLRANTNLRIALRMADEHESSDVLGDKMAAFFDPGVPGRAAAKTGPGRVAQFQSGYPGAKTSDIVQPSLVEAEELNFGAGVPWRIPRVEVDLEHVRPDIERIVEAIQRAAVSLPTPRPPWLDALADVYNMAHLGQAHDSAIVIGMVDDPDQQQQRVEWYRPERDGNLAFFGSSGSGKTTALRSLATAASITPEAGDVHIYGVDFGGGGLKLLAPLPNVGGIIDGSDDERVGRLFGWLRTTVEDRQARYSHVRAATLAEFRRMASRPGEPRILVLIDGVGTFKSEYDKTSDRSAIFAQFQQLLNDGGRVGVHFVVSAERPAAVPMSLATSFQRKFVLRQTDEDGYRYFGLPRDVLTPDSAPGRAMEVGRALELQVAILGDSPNVALQGRALENLAARRRVPHSSRPHLIQALPDHVPAGDMPASVAGRPVVGLSDETFQALPLEPATSVLVWGGSGTGRTNAMRWLATSVSRWNPEIPLVHLTSVPSALAESGLWGQSATGPVAVAELLGRINPMFGRPTPDGQPVGAVFVEGLDGFVRSSASEALLTLVRACRENGHLVVVECESGTWQNSWELSSELRAGRTGLMLQPEWSDLDILRASVPRFKKSEQPPGRGFWIQGGKATKVQVPLVE